MKIRENVPISELTTMRLGGAARYVVAVEQLAEVPQVFEFVRHGGELTDGQTSIRATGPLPWHVLGAGANSLGRDEGYNGVIILNRLKGMEVLDETADEALVRGMGGETWDDFVAYTVERDYSGIEALSSIPGTLGAAPVQNIGAYGQEIAQVIDHVDAYDTATGELVVLGREEMQMRYRKTIFNSGADAGRYFITAVTVLLENDEHLQPPFYNSLQQYLDQHQITDYSPANIRQAVAAVRAGKLPDPATDPSAGSFFQNIYLERGSAEAEAAAEAGIPLWDEGDSKVINSGWLVEQAGLSGQTLHGMLVWPTAALILVNRSARSYADLAAARAEIRQVVQDKYGFFLAQEPVEVGSGDASASWDSADANTDTTSASGDGAYASDDAAHANKGQA